MRKELYGGSTENASAGAGINSTGCRWAGDPGNREEGFLKYIEKSPHGFFLIDQKGNCLEANPALARITGYEREELLTMNIQELLAPDMRETGRRYFESLVREGSFDGELLLLHKNKEARWWSLAAIKLSEKRFMVFAMDVTESKRAVEALRYQGQFQKLVASISSSFLNLSSSRAIDGVINRALELSGNFFHLDRGYLFLYSDDGKTMDNTHEWCSQGVEPQMGYMKEFPVNALPWWWRQMERKKPLHIPDVEKLPPNARAEKEEFRRQGIRSMLAIPLVLDEEVFGFMGFDAVKRFKSWDENEISLISVIAESMANALIKHRMEELIRQSEERYRSLTQNLPVGVYRSTPGKEGKFLMANPALLKILGVKTEEELKQMRVCDMYYHSEEREKASREVIRRDGYASLELKLRRRDGTTLWCNDTAQLIQDAEGNPLYFDCILEDITHRKNYEAQLEYLSFHDQLTGLYNRAYFENELKRLQDSREYPITIICSDMDGLKLINDSMGHHKGDQLLKRHAEALKMNLRKSDIVARMGGDEFMVILPRTDQKAGERVVQRIKSHVERYNREETRLPLSISLGAKTAEDAGVSLEEVLKEADQLMYREKLEKGTSTRSQLIRALMRHVWERDSLTAQRLASLCRRIGKRLNLSQEELSNLALLIHAHNIGMLGIPDAVANKTPPLSRDERDIIKQHPEKGYRIALFSPELSGIADLILKHHERWDGKGYPLQLKGRDIPIECRILHIADAYVAMTKKGSYREALSHQDALEEISKNAGSQFDPELVEVFLSLKGKSWKNSEVKSRMGGWG